MIFFLSVLLLCLVLAVVLSLKKLSFVKKKNTTWLEAYAISLRGQTDRQETLVRRFERQGIRILFFDAVDTREERWMAYTGFLTEKGLLALTKTVKTRARLSHEGLTPGAVGCFLSHLALWEKFSDTDRVHLVLEDDSRPTSSFGKELRTILEHFPRDADIFLLTHQSTNAFPVAHLPYPCSVLSRKSSFFQTNCYLISPSGIRKILTYFHHDKKSRFEVQVDAFLSAMVREGVLRVYVSDKQLCTQDNSFPTTIQGFRVV